MFERFKKAFDAEPERAVAVVVLTVCGIVWLITLVVGGLRWPGGSG